MTELTLVIRSEARTADDKITGQVKSVVDRGTRTVTHLVVKPKDREGLARLVRLDGHVDAQDNTIALGYTEAEFKNLTAAEEAPAEVFDSRACPRSSSRKVARPTRAARARTLGTRGRHLGS